MAHDALLIHPPFTPLYSCAAWLGDRETNTYFSGDVTLEQLVEEHDTLMYGPPPNPNVSPHFSPTLRGARPPHAAFHHVHVPARHPHRPRADTPFHHTLRKLANVTIINSSRTLGDLWESLDEMNLTDGERLRPRWDTYFMVRPLSFIRSICPLGFVMFPPLVH